MGEGQSPHDHDPRALVAFDFDGTLTIKDSYTAFLRWREGAARFVLRGLRLAPDLVAYPLHRDREALKAAATRVYLGGVEAEVLAADARRFAAAHFDALLRPDALACWRGWGERGVRRVIVTASPEPVVAPFAAALGAEGLIGTRLVQDQRGRLTGGFDGPNCRSEEKVVRLRAAFGDDVRILAAYGDTTGDREMLAAAAEPHFRVFTARP